MNVHDRVSVAEQAARLQLEATCRAPVPVGPLAAQQEPQSQAS